MEDNAKFEIKLNLEHQRYAELYPSVLPRLRAILATSDPELRRRIDELFEAAAAQEAARRAKLAAIYRLTPTECRLALHLMDGGDLAGYADHADVSLGTARSQLKSIFAKTGVNRQADLVRLGQTLG